MLTCTLIDFCLILCNFCSVEGNKFGEFGDINIKPATMAIQCIIYDTCPPIR